MLRTRKLLIIVTVVLLTLSLLAGCGGSSTSDNKKADEPQTEGQSEAQQDSSAPAKAETPAEPAGSVELNKVIYDANGIKITAVSMESRLSELDKVEEKNSVFNLSLHIERTGTEKNTVYINTASVNGFGPYGLWSFLIGSTESYASPISDMYFPFLENSDEMDVVFCVTKGYADRLDLKSIGEIGFVLEIVKEDGIHYMESVKTDLGMDAEPCCSLSLGEVKLLDRTSYLEVSNPADSVLLVDCLLRAFDTDGNQLYSLTYDYQAGEEYNNAGYFNSFYIRNGADSLPVSMSIPYLMYENGDPVNHNDVGSVKIEYVSAVPLPREDLSNMVSYEMEGRMPESDELMIFRCTWPDEYPRLIVYGECFIYTDDGALYNVIPISTKLLKDDDYRDYYDEANPETGAMDAIVVDCERQDDGGEFRFDIHLNLVTVDDQG